MADYYDSVSVTDANALFGGDHDPIGGIPITLVSPVSYTKGNALGKVTASSKYKLYDSAAADGSQTLAGILVDDVDALTADGVGEMWVHGEFLYGAITATSPTTVPVGTYGMIVIKPVGA